MSATTAPAAGGRDDIPHRRSARDSSASWRLTDRIGLAIAWVLGVGFLVITVAIVAYLMIQGIRYVRLELLVTSPAAGFSEADSGGFLDPMIGTLAVAVLALAIALPVGIGVGVWLSEYGRPTALARVAESTIEMLAGTPSIVFALFGVLVFQSPILAFASYESEGVVYGRSFLAAGAMLSLIALPLIVANVREGLQAIPGHVREASYAVGKTKSATTRRVLLPAARPSVVTGAMLGLGRVVGDTAVVILLLGATLRLNPIGDVPVLGALRGTGGTLTTYVYANAPTGEANQPTKAYAAAFVLLAIVLSINFIVDVAVRRGRRMGWGSWKPPPVRVLPLDGSAPAAIADPVSLVGAASRRAPSATVAIDRMEIDELSIAYGPKLAVDRVSLPVRQGEVLALIGPSGCGKTTLLRSLNRLTELTAGTSMRGAIRLDGEDIATFEPTALRRRVTMVFQQPNPFPMSVFDNVAYVLREQAARRPRKRDLRDRVRDALTRAGLYDEVADSLDHPALRLSGGQQQRLCIARALAADPEVLLLDEPCSALDPQSTQVIEDLIVSLREELAVVIVTHNLQQAHRIADHVAFMYLGELVEYGPAEQLFRAPRQQRTREYVSGAFG